MFTFEAMPVKFVGLLVMFAWCTVWCVYELSRRQSGRHRISSAWHALMAVVMLLMVAGPTWKGLTGIVPTPVLAGVFAVGTAWFVWLTVDAARASKLHFAGHAAMFGAMTWHLAAMAAMAMARMSGGGMGSMGGARQPGGTLWWFALAGVPLMGYLLVAGVRAMVRIVRPAPSGEECHGAVESPTQRRLGAASEATMNLGMFWMSTGIMVPLLPFFAALSF